LKRRPVSAREGKKHERTPALPVRVAAQQLNPTRK